MKPSLLHIATYLSGFLTWKDLLKPAFGFQGMLLTSLAKHATQNQIFHRSTRMDFVALPRTKQTLYLVESSDSTANIPTPIVDVDAIVKYVSAIGIQMSLLFALMSGLDQFKTFLPFSASDIAGRVVNFILFYSISLKSRIFNPLANNRPLPKTLEVTKTVSTTEEKNKRIMPSWTPPGPVFPIVWLLLIAPLRAYTAALVVSTTGTYACIPILALLLHLSIGDVWNTINNVERRYGFSVVGVLAVWLSKANAAYQFFRVNEKAGMYLSAALIWLTIASTLVTATWRLNPDLSTGKPDPLYPVIRQDVKTKFVWFQ